MEQVRLDHLGEEFGAPNDQNKILSRTRRSWVKLQIARFENENYVDKSSDQGKLKQQSCDSKNKKLGNQKKPSQQQLEKNNKHTVGQSQEINSENVEKPLSHNIKPCVNIETNQIYLDESAEPESVIIDSASLSSNNCKSLETADAPSITSETKFSLDVEKCENGIQFDTFIKDKEDSNKISQETISSNEYYQVIQSGEPHLYLLHASENSVSATLRWFEIGHRSSDLQIDHKVIILMGATGCGKSTLINGMVNYILGIKWTDHHRFKCVREDESESQNQAHSQTSSVTAYTIHHREGMVVPYSITIIDTPGYGDTRGVARDREITKTIHQFLMEKDARIDVIHAACFVAASSDSRLTVTQRYIIDSVLSIFGKDFKDNIRLLVTFADNAVPPVVEACRVAHFPETSPSAGITYSKFNSSVLYASTQKQQQTEFEDICLEELYWDMGQENFENFFTMLKGMKGKDLKSTRQVIQHRKVLEQSLKDIESELEECFLKIENIDMFVGKMKRHGHRMETNKNFTIIKTEMRQTKIDCEEGLFAYNCATCNQTCEAPLRLTNPTKGFSRKNACGSQKCLGHEHSYETFSFINIPINVETTLQKMKAEYEINNKRKLKTDQDLLAQCSEDLNRTKNKVIDLLTQIAVTGRSLDSTALRSNALTPADYLSLMRSRVAEEQAPGYQRRLETLMELQQLFSFTNTT